MEIKALRDRIDIIDDELTRLFVKRMEISAQVAAYKRENNLPIYVPAREQEILRNISGKVNPEMEKYAQSLYSLIFDLSRSYQKDLFEK